MAEELDAPGAAQGSASKSAHPGHTANWIAIFAVVVAGVSAFFTWLTYQNSSTALRQYEESFFLRDRIEACMTLSRSAAIFAAEAEALAGREGRASEKYRTLRARTVEIVDSARLVYLGPSALATTEIELITAIGDVTEVFGDAANSKGGVDAAALERTILIVNSEISDFQSQCTAALGAYRHGPGDAKPGKTVFAWKRERERWNGRERANL